MLQTTNPDMFRNIKANVNQKDLLLANEIFKKARETFLEEMKTDA